MKKQLIKYSIATFVGGAFALTVLLAKGFFTTDVAIIKYRMLIDAFSAPGMIMTLLPFLFWISTDGLFDGLTYALQGLANMLTFRGIKKQEKYYDYKKRKAEKRMTGFWFILFVGLGFMLISGIFLILYYTNGGTEAYIKASGA